MLLKQIPEDFVVRERLELEFSEHGEWAYYLLRKRNIAAFDALTTISRVLGLRESAISIAGLKDRRAITEQHIAIKRGPPRSIKLGALELRFLGRGKRALCAGQHAGNSFEIVVRGIDSVPNPKRYVLNYFDIQRFSSTNAKLGKALLKGEFSYVAQWFSAQHKDVRAALASRPRDFVGALTLLPRKLLRLCVHAYQAFLWNATVSKLLSRLPHTSLGSLAIPLETPEQRDIPIVGFDFVASSDELGQIISELLKAENIEAANFISRPLPWLSAESRTRPMLVELSELAIGQLEPDELNPKKSKIRLSFVLPPGAYATMAVAQLFSASA